MANDFDKEIAEGYSFGTPTLFLGAPLREGKVAATTPIVLPVAMMNRHGLIAGATGTGKTKSLQSLAGQLSALGVPAFLADLKGDLSGLGSDGVSSPKIEERARACGIPFKPQSNPVEFVSLTGTSGIQLRATVSSFGPILLARALGLNETQQSVLALVFRFCDEKKLLLLDLPDLREVLRYLTGEGSAELEQFGGISKATAGVLLRKIVELEQQGADAFFGEPEFDVDDLLRVDEHGRGVLTVLELSDIQDRPALFSTFMMWLLASLYRELPEVGDIEKPKLVFFFDEAHLLFEEASKAFLDEIEQVVRLIRSKGVGVFFITQVPKDVPPDVLAQLGNRIQHALRAFTPDDEKAIRATANTFPRTPYYDIPKTLTSLGIGEALVTVLGPRGTPTPVVATLMAPPMSLMGAIPPEEIARHVASSRLHDRYAKAIDRESAREVLQARVAGTAEVQAPAGRAAAAPTAVDTVGTILKSPMARAVGKELVRGLFGVLGVSTSTRRRSRW
jgi:DNA double-strand break repair helicase HerA and related ATPase